MGMPVILGLVGGILMIVSLFLPWATVTLFGIPVTFMGITAGIGGILMLVFGIIGIVMLMMKNPTMPLVGGIMGILSLVFWLLSYLGLSALVAPAQLTGGGVGVGLGIGLWIAPLGALLLTVGGFMQWSALKKMPKAM